MKKVPTLRGNVAFEADLPDAPSFLAENAVALGLIGLGALWTALITARQGREFVSAHPLTTGTLAVATGVGIALALPETGMEKRAVGPVARELADRARGVADHVRADVRTARRAVNGLRAALSPGASDSVTQQADRSADAG